MNKEQLQMLLMAKPDLFDGLKHHDQFMDWYPGNMHVINAFGRYAHQLQKSGRRDYYSCYAIRERIRWDSMVSEEGTEYKISNNVTPYIARILMAFSPELDGIFRTKEQRSEDQEET